MGDRDLVLFEHLQNPEMRETARKASAEGEAHAWPSGRGYRTSVHGVALRILVARHERRMTGTPSSTNGPRGLKKQYQCT